MYKVIFNGAIFSIVSTIEEACQLGLAVHRSSNQPHDVTIFSDDSQSSIVAFTLTAPPAPSSVDLSKMERERGVFKVRDTEK